MKQPRTQPDGLIAALAARQGGLVAARQVAALGLTRAMVRHRIANGRWHEVHRGVWAVGHPGDIADRRSMAAVLSRGPGAFVAARSAVHGFDLLPGPAPLPIEVAVVRRSRHTRTTEAGIRVLHPRSLSVSETTLVDDVPTTTAPRALADFAVAATDEELATAVHRAHVRGLLRHEPAVRRQLARSVAGIGRLRRLIEPQGPDLRGALEIALRAFVVRGGWEPYEPNVLLHAPPRTFRADALWREAGFAIELDSWRHHADRAHFERDRATVLAADELGIDLKRVTWFMLHGTPEVVAALLDRKVPRRR